jgi:hypothetical protein
MGKIYLWLPIPTDEETALIGDIASRPEKRSSLLFSSPPHPGRKGDFENFYANYLSTESAAENYRLLANSSIVSAANR